MKTSMMSCHSSIKSQSINFFIILALHQQQQKWTVFIIICACLAKCKEVTFRNRSLHNSPFSSLRLLQETVVSNRQTHGLRLQRNISCVQIHMPQCPLGSAGFVQRGEVYCLKAEEDSAESFKKNKEKKWTTFRYHFFNIVFLLKIFLT